MPLMNWREAYFEQNDDGDPITFACVIHSILDILLTSIGGVQKAVTA